MNFQHHFCHRAWELKTSMRLTWMSFQVPWTLGEGFGILCSCPASTPDSLWLFLSSFFSDLCFHGPQKPVSCRKTKCLCSFKSCLWRSWLQILDWSNCKVLSRALFRGKTLKLMKLPCIACRFYCPHHHGPWHSMKLLWAVFPCPWKHYTVQAAEWERLHTKTLLRMCHI